MSSGTTAASPLQEAAVVPVTPSALQFDEQRDSARVVGWQALDPHARWTAYGCRQARPGNPSFDAVPEPANRRTQGSVTRS